ncbi:MAG: hypothetical protein ACYDCL_14270 [Myxococcales bacterium]
MLPADETPAPVVPDEAPLLDDDDTPPLVPPPEVEPRVPVVVPPELVPASPPEVDAFRPIELPVDEAEAEAVAVPPPEPSPKPAEVELPTRSEAGLKQPVTKSANTGPRRYEPPMERFFTVPSPGHQSLLLLEHARRTSQDPPVKSECGASNRPAL